ncbi:unnamed protein product, partial [Brassica rapa]
SVERDVRKVHRTKDFNCFSGYVLFVPVVFDELVTDCLVSPLVVSRSVVVSCTLVL